MKEEELKFTSEQFWQLIEMQGKKCALTNRELSPISCELELKDPKKAEHRFRLDNFYLVDRDLKYLCRHLSEEQVIELCAEVIQHSGKNYGYTLRRSKHE